jgi:hypothetical protein
MFSSYLCYVWPTSMAGSSGCSRHYVTGVGRQYRYCNSEGWHVWQDWAYSVGGWVGACMSLKRARISPKPRWGQLGAG